MSELHAEAGFSDLIETNAATDTSAAGAGSASHTIDVLAGDEPGFGGRGTVDEGGVSAPSNVTAAQPAIAAPANGIVLERGRATRVKRGS